MTLSFPNQSRSFEANKSRVRFWGYDSSIEVTFFIELDALLRVCPGMNMSETGIMSAFDDAVERIHQIAQRVYERRRQRSYAYVLAAEDF